MPGYVHFERFVGCSVIEVLSSAGVVTITSVASGGLTSVFESIERGVRISAVVSLSLTIPIVRPDAGAHQVERKLKVVDYRENAGSGRPVGDPTVCHSVMQVYGFA